MRFQHLGKTHRIRLFTIEVRIIYVVSSVGGLMVGFLSFAWGLLPLPLGLNFMVTLSLSTFLAKVSEVPFSKEIIYTRLKGRVSLDP